MIMENTYYMVQVSISIENKLEIIQETLSAVNKPNDSAYTWLILKYFYEKPDNAIIDNMIEELYYHRMEEEFLLEENLKTIKSQNKSLFKDFLRRKKLNILNDRN